MDKKNDNSGSGNDPFSDGVELFDSIFSEGADAAATDTKKEQPRSPAASAKTVTPKPVKQAEQIPAPPKEQQTKKAAPPAQPTKKGPAVKPDTPKEKQPGSDSKNESFSDGVELFDDIFSEGTKAAATDTRKEQPRSPAPSGKAPTPSPVKKIEQRPESPKPPPVQKTVPQAQPIKKSPTVKPDTPMEKQPGSGSENEPFPGGVGLFDDIFSEGTDADAYLPEIKKVQPHSPAQRAKAVVTSKTAIEVEKTPEPPKGPSIQKMPHQNPIVKSEPSFGEGTYVGKISGKYEGPEKQEIEFHEKTRKNVNPFIFISSILALVLLSMMAGRVINYDGIIEYVKKTTHLQSDKKTQIVIDDNNNTKAGKVIDKESKIQDSNIQAPQPSKAVTPPVTNNAAPEKVVAVQATDKIIPSEKGDKDEKSSVSTTPPISEKVTDKDRGVLDTGTLSYPYSIYLGSYDTIEGVKEAKSDFEEMGLSPYWIRMDLGEKGIWFRLYANYFQTREEVDRFIKNIQIPDAESKKTNFVNLIGIYTSQEEVYKQKEGIEKLGYCPYVIEDNKNIFRLYVGAFYQKELAEEQNSDLLLKGIQSKVVER